jgi:hypothetical protein
MNMEKPSHKLAGKIVTRLIKEKLISEQAGKKLLPKLAEGKLRAEDWRLPLEVGTEKKLQI